MQIYTLKCLSRSVTPFVTACAPSYPAFVTGGDKRGDRHDLPLEAVTIGVDGHLVTKVTDFWVNLLMCARARTYFTHMFVTSVTEERK